MEMAEYCLATSNKRKKSKNDKRRFSDEQIRCLEVMFESETKLDPRKKVEVARELGLQPRQVAIWFQNKRARWKSKHIEKEYALLLADYNNLAAQFESLNKEKHSLLLQLQKVKSEISRGKGGDEKEIHELEGGARYGSSDGEESDSVKIDLLQVKNSVSDDDSIDINQQQQQQQQLLQLRDEDEELLRMVDTSDWGTLDSDDIIINQATQTSCHWWGFWS